MPFYWDRGNCNEGDVYQCHLSIEIENLRLSALCDLDQATIYSDLEALVYSFSVKV